MTILSSVWSPLWKWLSCGFAFLFGGMALMGVAGNIWDGRPFPGAGVFIILICGGFAFHRIRKIRTVLVDSVTYHSTTLKVSRGGQEETIALEEIERIEDSTAVRPETISLFLKRPSRLGRKLVFYPPQSYNPFDPHPIAAALKMRVAELKLEKKSEEAED